MNKCFIITSYLSSPMSDNNVNIGQEDYIICADGGYAHALHANIVPHVVIGDFDSLNQSLQIPARVEVLSVGAEKDDTDTMLCLKYGMEKGFDDFVIIGGLGGRLDHTFANLQTMSYAVDHQIAIRIIDGKNQAIMIGPGTGRENGSQEVRLPKAEGCKLSLFSFSDQCRVTIQGVKYPLQDYLLTSSFPLGTSNEFAAEEAVIVNHFGKLLIILSKD